MYLRARCGSGIARPRGRWMLLGVLALLASLGGLAYTLLYYPSLRLVPFRPYSPHLTSSTLPSNWSYAADRVRSAFVHAYSGYLDRARGFDELLPVSGGKINNFNGWGVTMFDSLDTMLIMDLRDEFNSAIPAIADTTFWLPQGMYAPFFETVIRYLGGILSAYALSGEAILLSRANDLGRMLLPAFNTSSGFPTYSVNTVTRKAGGIVSQRRLCRYFVTKFPLSVPWAEAASCQMEFKYLAKITGRTEYYHTVEKVMEVLEKTHMPDGLGLLPTFWDSEAGLPLNTQYSVGAAADSAHEYFIKQWLLSGRSEPRARDLYLRMVKGIIENLLYLSPDRKLLYATDVQDGQPSYVFEHLSCFLPGVLALGAHTLSLSPHEKQLHEWAAKGIAQTCWITYADQAKGLGPDGVLMHQWPGDNPKAGRWMDHITRLDMWGGVPPGLQEVQPEKDPLKRDYEPQNPVYLLRPETVESFYILWRTTGDPKWRDRGWAVFEAIEKHARTQYGYTSISDTDIEAPGHLDSMPSYFLAETLKYLYLLFNERDIIPLDKWVFTTEAHPLPIFEWSSREKEEFGLDHA